MAALIETPFTLLQKPVEVVLPDPVVLAHMTLRLVPEIPDAINVAVLVDEEP